MITTITSPIPSLQLLKLGGSLITVKTQPRTPRLDVLRRLAAEIAVIWHQNLGMRLIIGHGAGSFGHVSANKYGTRQGVHTSEEWLGFAEVWWDASALNRLVMDALHEAGLPAIALPPSASVIAREGQVERWDLALLQAALQAGLLPVVYGDVIFDTVWGGTILSTEDLFAHLARQLRPTRLLLAGIEMGVWVDYPINSQLIKEITPHNLSEVAPALEGSAATDVTGGMASKVQEMLRLIQEIPGLEVLIFSGERPGLVQEALCGAQVGTLLNNGRK
jgi:isopentenyl phosphate kinase